MHQLPSDPSEVQFHLLSFEGPDLYSFAGGLGSRVVGLSQALADQGFQTHLWFVGDPQGEGHEVRGNLHLHRWCQWLSRYHPKGVYDGEEAKVEDYARSLPSYIMREHLMPQIVSGGQAIVFAEEWHTSFAYLGLADALSAAGMRGRAGLYWNANNTYGFDRVQWGRMSARGHLTTVSRYMKHRMWDWGVDPIVIPNGLDEHAYAPPEQRALRELRTRMKGRLSLAKMARWDPDKGWLEAVAVVDELKAQGLRPLLLARGGSEPHGAEVIGDARRRGLRVASRSFDMGPPALIGALTELDDIDVLCLESHIDPETRRVLFRGVNAVLANSLHEPFGLVGLEAMAAGGVACTGSTGEDYAVPGRNAIVLDRRGPGHAASELARLHASPDRTRALRRAGQSTARDYSWPRVFDRVLLPNLSVHPG